MADGNSNCGVWDVLALLAKRVPSLKLLDTEKRLLFLLKSAPSRIVSFLLRHRYIIIGILFNLPGNAITGGGGGIGLVAGVSRLFSYPKYLLLVTLEITPGPISFLLRDML